jgi:hypothetical protein
MAQALALIPDHAAKDVGERSADSEDRDDLHQIGQCSRVLEGMRRIGIEETASGTPAEADPRKGTH